jgi:hypothetical protein
MRNYRCNTAQDKLISTPVDMALQVLKKYEIKFRTIHLKSSIIGATTDICDASDFTTRQ